MISACLVPRKFCTGLWPVETANPFLKPQANERVAMLVVPLTILVIIIPYNYRQKTMIISGEMKFRKTAGPGLAS
jgi:hypothetical protein